MTRSVLHNVWIAVAALFVLSILFQVAQDIFHINTLSYHRSSFVTHWWRQWITPSLVHADGMHWLLNMLNLFALVVLFGYAWSAIRLVLLFGASSAFIMFCLYCCSETITSYVGMSGVLYTLAVYGAILSFSRQRLIASLVLTYVTIKLFAHDWINSLMEVDKMLDGLYIVTDVHLYGTLFGLIAGIVTYLTLRVR